MDRIEREKRVVEQMVTIYCRKHHGTSGTGLCDECAELLEYAHRRLSLCPKGASKTSCRKCDIHCYSPSHRAKIRAVMKYVGPRMLFYHPLSAIRHLVSELR